MAFPSFVVFDDSFDLPSCIFGAWCPVELLVAIIAFDRLHFVVEGSVAFGTSFLCFGWAWVGFNVTGLEDSEGHSVRFNCVLS